MTQIVTSLVASEKVSGRFDFRIRYEGKRGRPTLLCFGKDKDKVLKVANELLATYKDTPEKLFEIDTVDCANYNLKDSANTGDIKSSLPKGWDFKEATDKPVIALDNRPKPGSEGGPKADWDYRNDRPRYRKPAKIIAREIAILKDMGYFKDVA